MRHHLQSSSASKILFLILTFLAADTVLAQGMGGGGGGGGRPPAPPIPDVDKESLIFSVPDKWYPYSRTTENKDETFMFPTGQKPEKWTRGFRVEQFFTNLGASSAQQIYDMKIKASESACAEHTVTRIQDGQENAYPMALWSETCVMDANNSNVTMTKVIVGSERLYIVSKIWKNNPKDREIARWQRTFGEIFVCDPNTRGHSCTWLRNRSREQRGMGR